MPSALRTGAMTTTGTAAGLTLVALAPTAVLRTEVAVVETADDFLLLSVAERTRAAIVSPERLVTVAALAALVFAEPTA